MNHRLRSLALLTLLMLAPAISRGADILTEVPSDALGFVLIRNLSSADTKIAQLGTLLQRNIPQPLAFLKEFAGIAEGLNADGDCLVAMFPGSGGSDESLQFCVWLPVTDYERFLTSLGATSIDGVAAVTVAGEDLLVAHHGDWALLMNPDQRERIAEVSSASPSKPQMPRWNKWIEANDVTVVAFSPGVRSLVSLIDGGNADKEEADSAEANGPKVVRNQYQNRSGFGGTRGINFGELFEFAKLEFQKWSVAMPELADAMHQANVIGCGLRVDANGSALTSVRVGLYDEATKELVGDAANQSAPLPLSLYENGGFVMNGAGRVPTPILAAYAKAYARYAAADLKTEERTVLDEMSFQRLLEAIEPAAADVRSIAVLSQPGEAQEPVYTNNFVAIRVDSAAKAIEHVKEVMRLWNSANRDAKGDTKLVFDVEETKLGERTATQYSLDMTALEGGIVVPEVRQAMEKLFGPGGKMRLWIVPTDEHTLLMATATQEQVTAALTVLDKKQLIDWKRGELGESNALLPAESDWRIFIDGHRYFEWQRREKAGVIGVPVIGGPLVRDFPASPPVGIAGGFREGELWFEMAALAPTLKSADVFLYRNRSRAAFQLRGRVLAPAQAPAPAPAQPPK